MQYIGFKVGQVPVPQPDGTLRFKLLVEFWFKRSRKAYGDTADFRIETVAAFDKPEVVRMLWLERFRPLAERIRRGDRNALNELAWTLGQEKDTSGAPMWKISELPHG